MDSPKGKLVDSRMIKKRRGEVAKKAVSGVKKKPASGIKAARGIQKKPTGGNNVARGVKKKPAHGIRLSEGPEGGLWEIVDDYWQELPTAYVNPETNRKWSHIRTSHTFHLRTEL